MNEQNNPTPKLKLKQATSSKSVISEPEEPRVDVLDLLQSSNTNRSKDIETEVKNEKGGIYKILSIILLIINCTIAFVLHGGLAGVDISKVIGEVVGSSILLPAIVVGLVCISPSMRNERSQSKAFFFGSLLVLFSLGAQFMNILLAVAEQIQK